MLHNQHVNRLQRAHRRLTIGLDRLPEPACPAAQDEPLLRRDLRRLPLEQRIVLLLAGREEMSYDEIAAVLLVLVGTVRSRLWRARECLRRVLVD